MSREKILIPFDESTVMIEVRSQFPDLIRDLQTLPKSGDPARSIQMTNATASARNYRAVNSVAALGSYTKMAEAMLPCRPATVVAGGPKARKIVARRAPRPIWGVAKKSFAPKALVWFTAMYFMFYGGVVLCYGASAF